MPMDSWEDVAGLFCDCGNHATHFYCGLVLCCSCHGGEVINEEEARIAHEQESERSSHEIEANPLENPLL